MCIRNKEAQPSGSDNCVAEVNRLACTLEPACSQRNMAGRGQRDSRGGGEVAVKGQGVTKAEWTGGEKEEATEVVVPQILLASR